MARPGRTGQQWSYHRDIAKGRPTMSTETNKALVRRYHDQVLNDRRVEAIDEFAVTGYNEHDPLPGQREGRDGLKERVSMLAEGLAPTFTIEDIVAEADRVVVRWTNSARHV